MTELLLIMLLLSGCDSPASNGSANTSGNGSGLIGSMSSGFAAGAGAAAGHHAINAGIDKLKKHRRLRSIKRARARH